MKRREFIAALGSATAWLRGALGVLAVKLPTRYRILATGRPEGSRPR
jgi:hypothetical protein